MAWWFAGTREVFSCLFLEDAYDSTGQAGQQRHGVSSQCPKVPLVLQEINSLLTGTQRYSTEFLLRVWKSSAGKNLNAKDGQKKGLKEADLQAAFAPALPAHHLGRTRKASRSRAGF